MGQEKVTGGLLLKYLLSDLKISQAELGKAIPKPDGTGGYGKTIMSFVCNGKWEYFPKDPQFKEKVERWLVEKPEAVKYLSMRGYTVKDIWDQVRNGGKAKARGRRKNEGAADAKAAANAEGSREIEIPQEVEMLTFAAKKHFKIFKDPFQREMDGPGSIFMSEEARYMYYAMKEAATEGGFMAVVGEVGSGKSTARKWLEAELAKLDDVKVIAPVALDKSKLTDASLLDAFVLDLSTEAPRSGPEKKARQVRKLLIDRTREGMKIVLIIEEAQDLTDKAFKLLKRLHEIEDGFRKTLGIVLIGQTELGELLNERNRPEIREVSRRCQVAEIRGLNGGIEPYLTHKFKLVNVDAERVITAEAIRALSAKLTVKDGKHRDVSHAYPLTVNNIVTRAMNWSVEHGMKLVTEEVINAL